MSQSINKSMLTSALNFTYDKAVNGLPGCDTAEQMASNYMRPDLSVRQEANRLIRWQNTKAGTSGFVNGLGGIILMPATIPANITSVMYVQVRMIAAIAIMGGYNIHDDRVKTLVYACLCGNAAKDILKDASIKFGTKLTQQAIRNISTQALANINKAIGFRLLTKFGEKGVINLGKAVPLVGGLVGASFDLATTNKVGNIARDTFLPLPP